LLVRFGLKNKKQICFSSCSRVINYCPCKTYNHGQRSKLTALMRLCGGVCVIDDHQTHVWKWSAENQLISTVFAAVQLLIVTASFAQHAYSMCNGEGVFNCQFNTTVAGKNHSQFLAVDVIVFDYGLFQQLLGTDKCVANHLDGGYMRFVWCLVHLISLLLLLVQVALLPRTAQPALLRPAVFVQSIYSLGLIILLLATLPKMLSALINRFGEVSTNTSIYFAGTFFNWIFTLILWHFYWYVKALRRPPTARYKKSTTSE
ncbi:hypothetical protein T4E_11619, partial [Trichinella pseudospiralis]